MLKIRLSVTGKRNAKQYRVVVVEEGKKRDGVVKEIIGYYNPLVKPPAIKLDQERVTYWQNHGAQTTPAVKKLIKP